jgi:beta-lactamase superfamily II metal-dependent hydrolase
MKHFTARYQLHHKRKLKKNRHDHPIRKAVIRTMLLTGAIVSVFMVLNMHFGWFPDVTWQRIYQKTGLGISPYSEAPCQIRMLDVGAGDAILVRCDDQWMLIDTGLETKQERLVRSLRRCGVEQLDYLVLTHGHSDHIGGLERVLEEFRPKAVLTGKSNDVTDFNDPVRFACQKSGILMLGVRTGEMYRMGTLTMEVLSDGSLFPDGNNQSLVLRMRYGATVMLLMGDAETRVERHLLDSGVELRADWIKLAHHGSRSSSSESFLNAVSPRFAFVSCDRRNAPDEDVLQRLRDLGIVYARTDLNGELLFYTDGKICGTRTQNR